MENLRQPKATGPAFRHQAQRSNQEIFTLMAPSDFDKKSEPIMTKLLIQDSNQQLWSASCMQGERWRERREEETVVWGGRHALRQGVLHLSCHRRSVGNDHGHLQLKSAEKTELEKQRERGEGPAGCPQLGQGGNKSKKTHQRTECG